MAKKWKIAIVLFFVGAHNFADRSAVSGIFPILRHDLGLSDFVLAGVGAFFLWSYAAGAPVAGILADRFPRARLVQIGIFAWSLVMMGTALVHSGRELLVMRTLLGPAECLYVPAAFALIADHHGPETRATALGLQICGVNFGVVAGNTLAPFFSQMWGWRAGFMVLGAAGLLLGVVTLFVLEEGPQRAVGQGTNGQRTKLPVVESMVSTLRAPGYVLVVGASMLIAVCTWSLLNWLPLYYHEHFHLNLTSAGFTSTGALQSAVILGTFAGGLVSDRLAKRGGAARVRLLAVTRLVAAPVLLAFLFRLPMLALSGMMFTYDLMIGLGAASESVTICEVAGSELKSTAMGIFTLAQCVAGGAGVLAMVYLQHRFGWAPAFASLALVALFAGVLLLLARWRLAGRTVNSE